MNDLPRNVLAASGPRPTRPSPGTRGSSGLQAVAALLLTLCTGGCGQAEEGASPGQTEVPPDRWILETDTGGKDARAGLGFSVSCRTFLPRAQAAGAEPGGDIWGQEQSLPGAATLVVVSGPAPPLSIDGTTLTLGRAGLYRIACQVPEHGLVDETPAELPVLAGPPAWIETTLRPGPTAPAVTALEVVAGAWVEGVCLAQDAYGNQITSGWSLSSEPALEPPPVEMLLQARKSGLFALRCRVDGQQDDTPAALKVKVGPPRHIFTHLEPEQIAAGSAAVLSCLTTDAFGNPVVDFPISVSHPPQLNLKGKYLSATIAGLYDVRCVPETLAWDLFELHAANLHVVPGPAALLLVGKSPDKKVYKRNETVKFPPLVKDAFGNVIADAQVEMAVTAPPKGWKVTAPLQVKFALDGLYKLSFAVADHLEVTADLELLVDGAPPLLTIEYPPWGTTLDGKPSVKIRGKAGDDGAGIESLSLEGKAAYPDGAGEWFVQWGARHGLNLVEAVATDLGGEESRAIRGFYHSSLYYPTDAAKPEAAMAQDAIIVFLGKDFFDDGVHDPAHPDDLATIMEIAAGAIALSSVMPANINQGDIQVTLSNTSMGKPKISLTPVQGGLDAVVTIDKVHTDLKVKATIKLGPIKTSLSVSGAIDIEQVVVNTRILLAAKAGKAVATVASSSASMKNMKLSVKGIAGLFDPLWNLLLASYKSTFEKQIADALSKELPGAITKAFEMLAMTESFELDHPLGGPKLTLTLLTRVAALDFDPKGGRIRLNASFVASKGVQHTVLGAIGRGGCTGKSPDAFSIDESQKVQFAVHDDFINQLLYALWYAGGLKGKLPPELLAGQGAAGIDLSKADVELDLLLPPILEGCEVQAPDQLQVQAGDVFVTVKLKFGAKELALYTALGIEQLLSMTLGKDDKGQDVLRLQAVKDVPTHWLFEMYDIGKDFEQSKATWANLLKSQLGKELDKGLPGLSNLEIPLPPTVIDMSTLSAEVPAGTKLTLTIKGLQRKGGYTALSAGME